MDNDDIDEMGYAMETITDLLYTSEEDQPPVRGSRKGKKPNIDRKYEEVAKRLQRQYIADNPTYDSEMLRRRFRVSREIYEKIVRIVVDQDDYFVQKKSFCNKEGI